MDLAMTPSKLTLRSLILSASLFVSLAASALAADTYKLDPTHTAIVFHINHFGFSNPSGKFMNVDGTVVLDQQNPADSKVNVTIPIATIDTDVPKLDEHLKSKDFFDVKENPLITFHSDKIVQTGPTTFDLPGTFTIRGVSKPETLTFTATGEGTGSGEIKGTMAFDRKDYGMTKGIPFVTIADRVEVTVDLKGKRVSGPALVFKQ